MQNAAGVADRQVGDAHLGNGELWGASGCPSLCEETGKRRFSLQGMGWRQSLGDFRVPGAGWAHPAPSAVQGLKKLRKGKN